MSTRCFNWMHRDTASGGRDIALRCPRPRNSGLNESHTAQGWSRFVPSPVASLGDGDGAARHPYHWFFVFGLLVALFFTLASARADDLSSGFDAANKLYEEGKYPAAAAAYDKLLAGGNVSEALYFNRGNAEFKMGQLGRAIVSYRQAQRIAPRDQELRANLQLVRTRARGGSTYTSERWRSWLASLSLNEWTVLTSVAVWLVFIFLALGQWRPELKPTVRSYLTVSSVAAVFLGICLAVAINDEFFTTSAIVVTGEADVRNGPLDESPAIFKVRDGVELTVTDKKDGWLQVTDPAQRTGWLRQDQVIIFGDVAANKSGA